MLILIIMQRFQPFEIEKWDVLVHVPRKKMFKIFLQDVISCIFVIMDEPWTDPNLAAVKKMQAHARIPQG